MGTVFVAYGDHEGREVVLEFAAERARESGDDLYVYHVQETADESAREVHQEIQAVMERAAPDVSFRVEIEGGKGESDRTNVSTQKRLTDAILDPNREFEYVVMGNVVHGAVESLVLPSLTEAVLETREISVLLVPV